MTAGATVTIPGADGLSLTADVGGPEDGPTVVLLPGGVLTGHSGGLPWRVLGEGVGRNWWA
jgi:hypothetical protein